MIGLNDADVVGLTKAVARATNQIGELEQQLWDAVQMGRWLVAEARAQREEAEYGGGAEPDGRTNRVSELRKPSSIAHKDG